MSDKLTEEKTVPWGLHQ